jgi:2-methylcitrate dehydratase PrpD
VADEGGAAGMLAEAAGPSRFAALPGPVRAAYRNFMLDTLAVMAAGAAHASVGAARAAFVRAGGAGVSTAVGFATGVPAATAALVNGAAMTPLQLQDGHRRARGHPMSHVLPAALAIAEETGADTERCLDAVVAGYEVCARVGASLGGMQPLLHDTGTFGAIGAAVAAAHLLAEDGNRARVIEAAIGNAAAVALFPFRDTCMEGASAHHLFVGLGTQNGIHAARAALAGLQPSVKTLERFFGPRAGENFDAAALTAGIGEDGCWSRHEILDAYLKWHPVCAHLGPLLDCVTILQARLGPLAAQTISDVEIAIYSTALQYNSPHPQNDLAARFSFATVAALALIEGGVRFDSFAPDRFGRPEVQALASRVRLVADPAFDALYPAQRPSRVTLTLDGNRREMAEVRVPKGDGAAALSDADVRLKADQLLSHVWGRDHGAAVADLVWTIGQGVEAAFLPQLATLLRKPFTPQD